MSHDEDDGKTSEDRAEEDLEVRLKVIRSFYGNASDSAEERLARNSATARNILHEELGYFGPYKGAGYDLSNAERNRLLAHGRQDAAHALANTYGIVERLERIEKRQNHIFWLVSVALCAAAVITLAILGE